MNKPLLIILLLLTFDVSVLLSQELKDNYMGIYPCSVSNCSLNHFGQYNCVNASNTILKFMQTTNSLQIEVYFDDNSHFILSQENDSTFSYSGLPYISALFYSVDSVKLSRVHSSIGYSTYKGKKNPTAIDENPKGLQIKLSPNPFTNQILIENINSRNTRIQFLDINGKAMNVLTINQLNRILIAIDNIRQGTYILKIIDSNSIATYKMLKL